MFKIILLLAAALCVPHAAAAQDVKFPQRDQSDFTGVGEWRSQAPFHYYSGQCCYCLEASRWRSAGEGYGEYFVNGRWYKMPDTDYRNLDPNRPVNGVMICDPIQRQYPCVIAGYGG